MISDGNDIPTESTARTPGTHTIYCDESGFTGNNLLDPAQPNFIYAVVAIEPDEASELIAFAHRALNSDGVELKAGNLVGNVAGRKVLSEVLGRVAPRSVVSVSDKKFAIACKFFEYVFEPALAANSGFFYNIGFHKFVGNLLYLALAANDLSAEASLKSFYTFMSSRKASDLQAFLRLEIGEAKSVWRALSDCAVAYASQIEDELQRIRSIGKAGKWTLDLSTASLNQLLSQLGRRFERLRVFCDESQPIASTVDFLNLMVGNANAGEMILGSRVVPVGFNLAEPIHLVDSKTHPGIQVADFVATAVGWAFRGGARRIQGEVAAELAPLLDMTIFPVMPDAALVDLGNKDVALNGLLLMALQARTKDGRGPLDGIVDEYVALGKQYDVDPPSFARAPLRKQPKIGRNESCPCGSGKKYKRCCALSA